MSLAFLGIWFIGDITNLVGAVWANLVPTVIAIAIYFCIADTILIVQCLYYKRASLSINSSVEAGESSADEERQPLLHSAVQPQRPGSPTSFKRRGSIIAEDNASSIKLLFQHSKPWVSNTAGLLAVCALGAAGWAIAWQIGIWHPVKPSGHERARSQPLFALIMVSELRTEDCLFRAFRTHYLNKEKRSNVFLAHR